MDPNIAPDSPGGCSGDDPVLAVGSLAVRKRKPRRLREEGAVGSFHHDIRHPWLLACRHDSICCSAASRGKIRHMRFRLRIDQVALGIDRRWQERCTWFARIGASSIVSRCSLWIRGILLFGKLQSCSHLCVMESWTHVHSLRSWNFSKWSYRQLKMELKERSIRILITRWRHQCEDILLLDCLMITPLFVGPILSGKASRCHVVVMGPSVCRKRLFVHMAPTRGRLKRFRKSSLQQRRSKRTAPRVRGCNWRNTRDPRIVIDWLAATEHVKNTNKFGSLRVLSPGYLRSIGSAMGSTRRVHFEFCGEPEFAWTPLHLWCGGSGGERYLILPSSSSFMWTALCSREVKKCLRVLSRSGTSARLGREN